MTPKTGVIILKIQLWITERKKNILKYIKTENGHLFGHINAQDTSFKKH